MFHSPKIGEDKIQSHHQRHFDRFADTAKAIMKLQFLAQSTIYTSTYIIHTIGSLVFAADGQYAKSHHAHAFYIYTMASHSQTIHIYAQCARSALCCARGDNRWCGRRRCRPGPEWICAGICVRYARVVFVQRSVATPSPREGGKAHSDLRALFIYSTTANLLCTRFARKGI